MIVNDVAVPGKGIDGCYGHMKGDCKDVSLREQRVEEAAENGSRWDSVEDVTVELYGQARG
jgi:hypothetical protein